MNMNRMRILAGSVTSVQSTVGLYSNMLDQLNCSLYLNSSVNIITMNSDSHTHQHVLWPFGNFAVNFQQVRSLQCLEYSTT